MIGGVNSIGSSIAKVYGSNNQELADVMSRIASGKKFQGPGDDFVGYIRANTQQQAINDYQRVKENLMSAKETTAKAVEVGNAVYEDLIDLKNLVSDYNAADTDDERVAIAAEFDGIKSALADYITANSDVYATGAALTSVDLTIDGGGQAFAPSFTTMAKTSALSTTFGTAAPATMAASAQNTSGMATVLNNATKFLAGAEAADKAVDRHLNVVDTVIQTKQSLVAEITEIDDVKELAKQTDLNVRQQAAVSMIAQANMSQQGVMRLFM
jgi:flagellin-like hook-associated protein FlgL